MSSELIPSYLGEPLAIRRLNNIPPINWDDRIYVPTGSRLKVYHESTPDDYAVVDDGIRGLVMVFYFAGRRSPISSPRLGERETWNVDSDRNFPPELRPRAPIGSATHYGHVPAQPLPHADDLGFRIIWKR